MATAWEKRKKKYCMILNGYKRPVYKHSSQDFVWRYDLNL